MFAPPHFTDTGAFSGADIMHLCDVPVGTIVYIEWPERFCRLVGETPDYTVGTTVWRMSRVLGYIEDA
jgi:hypothetical protein